MAEAAAALADAPLVKIKVDRSDPEAQIRAVRAAAPRPRVIVDPNESWTIAEVERLQPLLAELRIDLLEQPLPANDDDALEGLAPLVPIRSEEHTSALQSLMRISYAVSCLNKKNTYPQAQ